MDLNLQHFGLFANAPVKNSFKGPNCIALSRDCDIVGNISVQLDGQLCDESKGGPCFHSTNRSGSMPNDSAFPKELLKKWASGSDVQLASVDLDDDCALVLGLGCNASPACDRGGSLPETSSTGPIGSLEPMQVCSASTVKSRVVWGLADGAASGISNHDSHNTIRGGQSVNSCPRSSTFFQPELLKNILQDESAKGSRVGFTASSDVDPDILELGLSRGSAGKGIKSQPSGFTKTDCLLVPGRRQVIPVSGTESLRVLHTPVDEGSTSARWKAGGDMPSLLMTPILENPNLDARQQLRNTACATMFPVQRSAENLTSVRESCGGVTLSGASGLAEQRGSSKTCKFKGCGKGARGASGLCIAHGGGHRCQKSGCNKGAESRTVYCKTHGGGRRCQRLGCTKSAEGRTDYCIGHGGGRRCNHEGCGKAARGKSGLCIRHGGGKRCQREGCTKSAEGYSGLCISHGGGRRCQYPDCSKGAQGSTMYCKAHGGGKRCIFTGCTKGAEGSTPLCKGHGGGKRCMFDGGGMCPKSVHGGTEFCVAHGGGKRCAVQGCTKSARGRTDYCVKHGGGKRCKSEGCGKSAQGSTDFCKAHGGGNRCQWGQVGLVYPGEILHGRNAVTPRIVCDRFARGKTGLCAAHVALFQDQRFHGGSALGPGIRPGLLHGLVPSTDSDSSANSALSSDNLPQFGSGLGNECFFKNPSETLNGIESSDVVPLSVNQNANKDDLESGKNKKNSMKGKLRASIFSETWSERNPLLKWNVYSSNGRQIVAAPTSMDSTNVGASKGQCGYQSSSIHPNIQMLDDANIIPGGTAAGNSVTGPQVAFVHLSVDQGTAYSQALGPVVHQQVISPQVLVPLSTKKRDLTSLLMERHDDSSGPNDGGSLSLPEGRVHGGSLMEMLAKDLRPGNVP